MLKLSNKPIPTKTYTPVGNQVALHVFEAEETDGGLVLPNNAHGSWNTPVCLVVAVGPDVKQITEGQKVLMSQTTLAVKVRHAGQETVILDAKHVLGVVG